MFLFDSTILIILPAILLGIWAQSAINRTYQKYSKEYARSGISAAQMARDLLDRNGLQEVRVERSQGGGLSDHYDPRSNALYLSASVYASSSVAALGVAAHEAGHAIQKNTGYLPLALRSALVPVANIGNYAAWPLLLLGLFMGSYDLAMIGVIVFAAAVLFQVVTLPVEFNASRRALNALEDGGYLDREEVYGASKVLRAAAMTYVAAALMSVLQLLRLMTIANRADRR